ncbi:hypothetical protein [Nocardia tengchongensis]|uniref:hypothetical protein n=1 Tax=Nocardia tengchongensis TaxID=2055889 RepID=UPI003696B61F
MRRVRIGLALTAFAAIAGSVVGSPLATADIQAVQVNATGTYYAGVEASTIAVDVTCDPAATPIAPPIYFTDNGQSMAGSPLAAGNRYPVGDGVPAQPECSQYQARSTMSYHPTTVGTHHIVATQYKPDGSVLSTIAQDVAVATLPPCVVNVGSAQYSKPCS